MLNLPKSTEFNKRIPKEKFYENLDISPALRKCFVEQIKAIYWANKIATTTTNLAPGSTVSEIEVFEIKLKTRELNEGVLRQIDKEIPYHIVFVLEYEEEYQVWIAHKKGITSGNMAFKVNQYYHTEWLSDKPIHLEMNGLNMDSAWDGFIVQIGGVEVQEGNTLDEQIDLEQRKGKLILEIEKLEKQSRGEKQPSKRFQMAMHIRELKKQFEQLK